MYLKRSTHHWPYSACALTIGNYDGVHLGHQAIVRELVAQAKARGLPAVLMMFEPQPLEYFAPEQAPGRIMPLSSKYQALQSLGLDALLVLPFNAALAGLSSQDFVEQLLCQQLAMKYLLIGDDFRFGQGRSGDFSMLQALASPLGYQVQASATIEFAGQRVSSTRVRQALQQGDFERVTAMLDRPYQLMGRVSYGQQLARQWGVPTANIMLRRRPALTGVFAVRTVLADGRHFQGVANLGNKPSLDDHRYSLEVHLFGQPGHLYGQRLSVEFVQRLRTVQKFNNLNALRAQIHEDVRQAQAIFDGNSLP